MTWEEAELDDDCDDTLDVDMTVVVDGASCMTMSLAVILKYLSCETV